MFPSKNIQLTCNGTTNSVHRTFLERMKVTNYYSLQPIVHKILSSCAQLVNNHEHNCVYDCLL